MATNPRPAGTRPAPFQKTRPAPPCLYNRVSGRVFFIQTGFLSGFNRVVNGSGFNENPESDPKYLRKKNLSFYKPKPEPLSLSLLRSDPPRPAPSSLSLRLWVSPIIPYRRDFSDRSPHRTISRCIEAVSKYNAPLLSDRSLGIFLLNNIYVFALIFSVFFEALLCWFWLSVFVGFRPNFFSFLYHDSVIVIVWYLGFCWFWKKDCV